MSGAFDPHSVNLGFGSMDPEKQREIASKGGYARGRQLHEQAEMRRELEAAGLHAEAEEVKPHVGFAAMDPQKHHEIASKGGHARGEQLHQQAELRHKLEDAGYHDLAERVKPHVGFAAMDPDVQREIAAKGGHARGAQMHEAAEALKEERGVYQ